LRYLFHDVGSALQANILSEELRGSDDEATAYLYTTSLTAPMSEDWTKISLSLRRWQDLRPR
jgi:hypothetical protein